MRKFLQHLLLSSVWLYRKIASPWVGQKCRFIPSCSQYSIDAIQAHGPYVGFLMTVKRICRCQPWGGSGFDPATDNKTEQERA